MKRSVVAVVAFVIVVLGGFLGGCATPLGSGGYATLADVVIDAERAARPDELQRVRVSRGGMPLRTERGMALERGDVVETGPGAYAVLHYATADVLMRPGSRGRIGSLTEMIGEVFTKLRGVFAVETTFVRAGADGTAYLVRTSADGSAAVVTVFDGTVTLASPQDAWRPRSLARGMTAECLPRTPPVVRSASADELEATRRWVEGVERVSPPRRNYGPAIAVGVIGALVGAILLDRGDRGRDPPAIVRTPGRGQPTPASPR